MALRLAPVAFLHCAAGLTTVVGLIAGCNSAPAPTSPSSRPAPSPTSAPASMIVPESESWSKEEALSRLADEKVRLSAAVRLCDLAELAPLWLGMPRGNAMLGRVRVVSFGDGWAMGLSDRTDGRWLRAPILIAKDGTATQPTTEFEEETAVLQIATDPEVFPHLLTTVQRVMLFDNGPQTAIQIRDDAPVYFAIRQERGISYVGLMTDQDGTAIEASRYVWDPYDLMFAGPAANALPEPPGGRFVIDLKRSQRLNPVGGELPDKPLQNREPPPPREVIDIPDGAVSG